MSNELNNLDKLLIEANMIDSNSLKDVDLEEGIVECETIEGIDSDKKYKAIKLKTNEFIFDATSLLLPFIAEYRGDKVLTVDVVQKRKDKDSTISVRSSVLGVPTLYDKSVLMALQKLFVMQKAINGKVLLNTNDPTEQERTMKPVTLREIYRAMGYKTNPTVNQLRKISESIERLAETTYIIQDEMVYNHIKDKYVVDADAKASMHLISYKKITYSEREKESRKKHASKKGTNESNALKYKELKSRLIDGDVQITFSRVVYESLSCDQLVYYNDPLVLSIKNTLARHIYVLAKKWAGKGKTVPISYNKLLMYIPMKKGKNMASQKTVLKNAINYLVENELCKVTVNNGVNFFNFNMKSERIQTKKEPTYLRDKYNTFKELQQGFVELGFEESYAYTIDMNNYQYYAALMRYVVLGVKYDRIKHPKEYMLDHIENNRAVDKKYYNFPDPVR